MHPTIEEFCRVPGRDACKPEFFRRVQRELRENVQPLLDERDVLLRRVVELETELAKVTRRGRPSSTASDEVRV